MAEINGIHVNIVSSAKTSAGKYLHIAESANSIIREIVDKRALLVFAECKRLSGTRHKSLSELRTAGHPYAKRHFKGKFVKGFKGGGLAAYIINNQSGDFFKSWKLIPTVVNPLRGVFRATILNDSDHAGYLDTGTDNMIKRPLLTFAVNKINRQHGRISQLISEKIDRL